MTVLALRFLQAALCLVILVWTLVLVLSLLNAISYFDDDFREFAGDPNGDFEVALLVLLVGAAGLAGLFVLGFIVWFLNRRVRRLQAVRSNDTR